MADFRAATMDVIHWCAPAKASEATLRKMLAAAGLDCDLYSDAPGTKYGRHKHDFDDFVVLVSGTMKIGTDVHTWVLRPGDRLDIPARTVHWAEVIGKQGVSYLSAAK